ncbi:unnamed protein product [Nezara viridula]|uniref:Uncharacterized protein n=1 Tax=Nezara viridula TaxID=85310 RepID=A0A9P0H3L3_NEZVI|nr:unnamed protein product [Nezara viridula]
MDHLNHKCFALAGIKRQSNYRCLYRRRFVGRLQVLWLMSLRHLACKRQEGNRPGDDERMRAQLTAVIVTRLVHFSQGGLQSGRHLSAH